MQRCFPPSSSIALNYMFHSIFHCVPPNFEIIYQQYCCIWINLISWHARRLNPQQENETHHYWSHQSIQLNSIRIQFNPYSIQFNPYSIQSVFNSISFNWINPPPFSWHYYSYDFAGTSAFSAVAAVAVTSINYHVVQFTSRCACLISLIWLLLVPCILALRGVSGGVEQCCWCWTTSK